MLDVPTPPRCAPPIITHPYIFKRWNYIARNPPHNCIFLNPKHYVDLDKYGFNWRFREDINNLIFCYEIFKRDNVLMNQLYQVVSMELNMLHIIVSNMIVNNLYDTLVITVDCSRGLSKKAKLSQKLVNPYSFSTCLNNAMILCFCSRQGDYLMFIARPHQRSSVIARSGLPIITVASQVEVGISK